MSTEPTGDPRVSNPGDDTCVIGLYDYLFEAKRRADQLSDLIDECMRNKYDLPGPGVAVETNNRRWMKKHCAGIVDSLINGQHPQAPEYRKRLNKEGSALESYLKDVRSHELALERKRESAARWLVRWIDDDVGVFEEVLTDYTADPNNAELWNEVQERFAEVIEQFSGTSLTRTYIRGTYQDSESWLKKYLLNKEAFSGIKSTTGAVVKILGVLSEVTLHKADIYGATKELNTIYDSWFPGIVLEVLPDKLRGAGKATLLRSLTKKYDDVEIKRIRLSGSSQPFEKLGRIANSDVLAALDVVFDTVSFGIATKELLHSCTPKNAVGFASNLLSLGATTDPWNR